MQMYKARLEFADQKAKGFWAGQMCIVRECYNFVSKAVFEEKTALNIKAFHNRFYYAEREKFPALPAQMCIKVYKQVLANYRTVRENKVVLEKSLEMKRPAVGLDKRLYSRLTRESFFLSGGDGKRRHEVKFVRYPKFDEMAAKYRMCDPTLTYDEKSGVFHACIPFAVPSAPTDSESCIGVDLGMKRVAVLSDGTAIADKEYLARRRRVRHHKRVFQRHKKKSHSARRKLKAAKRHEFHMSKEFCHAVANEILRHDGSVIVMEDLSKIKQRTSRTEDGRRRRRHNNAMSQVSFFRLKEILTYKAPLAGKRVATVSPHNTSRMDCRTQSADGCVRKGCRLYTADGRVLDVDWNAAINICNRFRPTPFRLPLDGTLNFVGRHRQQANRGSGLPAPQAAMSSAWR